MPHPLTISLFNVLISIQKSPLQRSEIWVQALQIRSMQPVYNSNTRTDSGSMNTIPLYEWGMAQKNFWILSTSQKQLWVSHLRTSNSKSGPPCHPLSKTLELWHLWGHRVYWWRKEWISGEGMSENQVRTMEATPGRRGTLTGWHCSRCDGASAVISGLWKTHKYRAGFILAER